MRVLTTLLAVGAAAALPAPDISEVPIVDLGYARYQGFYNDTLNVTGYYGIHYAASPSGQFYICLKRYLKYQ
jgi:hypothetical protein